MLNLAHNREDIPGDAPRHLHHCSCRLHHAGVKVFKRLDHPVKDVHAHSERRPLEHRASRTREQRYSTSRLSRGERRSPESCRTNHFAKSVYLWRCVVIDALVVANGRRRRNTARAVKRSPICPLGFRSAGPVCTQSLAGSLSTSTLIRTTHVSFYTSVILCVVNRPSSRFERPAQTDRPQGGSGRRPRKTADRRGGPVGRSADRGGGRLALEVGSCVWVTPHTLAAVNKLVSRNTGDTSALSPPSNRSSSGAAAL